MKFAKKVLALSGCFALGFLLSCATNVKQQTIQIEKSFAQPNLEQQIAEIGKTATVLLVGKAADGTGFTGSGFFVQRDLVVTNIHVLSGIHGKSYRWNVESINPPTQYIIKGVMASDPNRDLVILKVEGKGAGVLPLGDSDAVELSEEVIAVGTSYRGSKGAKSKIATGPIIRTTTNFFNIKTPLLPGHSGGPVLNSKGEVIGISVEGGIMRSSGNAIPSNHLKALLNDMPTEEIPLEKWHEEPLIRAYAYLKQGNAKKELDSGYKGAIKAYNTAIRLNSDFARAYLQRGLLKSELGDYRRAIADYNAAIQLGRDYSDVFSNRGAAKNELGNHKGAMEDCNIAIRLDPGYAAAYVNRGTAKEELDDRKGAIEDYGEAIRLKPTNDALAVHAYLKRADAKSALGENRAAIEDYDQAIRLKPTNDALAFAYLKRADAKSALGENKAAIEDYDQVIDLKPTNDALAAAYSKRADAKSALGENKAAIEDYDQVIDLKPKNVILVAIFYFKRADAKSALGENKAAIEDYDEGIRLAPIDALRAIGYVSRAEAKSNLRNDKGAIEDCDAAIRIDPNLAEAYETRAEAKSNLGNKSGAIEDYDKVVDLKPGYAKAYYKRGRAKAEIGNVSEAKADLQTALKLAEQESDKPLKTDIEKALRHLE